MCQAPSPEANGRSKKGTFAAGNKFAKGNPQAAKAKKLRHCLLLAVSSTELEAIVKSLVEAARTGDVSAAKLLFDRLLGPPLALDIEERLKTLEERLSHED